MTAYIRGDKYVLKNSKLLPYPYSLAFPWSSPLPPYPLQTLNSLNSLNSLHVDPKQQKNLLLWPVGLGPFKLLKFPLTSNLFHQQKKYTKLITFPSEIYYSYIPGVKFTEDLAKTTYTTLAKAATACKAKSTCTGNNAIICFDFNFKTAFAAQFFSLSYFLHSMIPILIWPLFFTGITYTTSTKKYRLNKGNFIVPSAGEVYNI